MRTETTSEQKVCEHCKQPIVAVLRPQQTPANIPVDVLALLDICRANPGTWFEFHRELYQATLTRMRQGTYPTIRYPGEFEVRQRGSERRPDGKKNHKFKVFMRYIGDGKW